MVYCKILMSIFVAGIFLVTSSFAVLGQFRFCPGFTARLNYRANGTSRTFYRTTIIFRSTTPDGYFTKKIISRSTRSFSYFGIRYGVLKYIMRCRNGHTIVKQPCHWLLNDGKNHTVSLIERHRGDGIVLKVDGERIEYPKSELTCNVTKINIDDEDDYDVMYQDLLLDADVNRSTGCIIRMSNSLPYWRGHYY